MSEGPLSPLELQAARERERLHDSVLQLKDAVRERVTPSQVLRRHMSAAMLVAGLGSLVLGYVTGSRFARS